MKKVFSALFFSVLVAGVSGCAALPVPSSSPVLVSHQHRPPRGLVEFCAANRARCELPVLNQAAAPAATDRPAIVTMDFERMSELRRVNTEVNRRITPGSDMDVFGRIDHWTDETTRGDCDDYVMTKRAELRALGWPPSSLLILLADTEQGERHVVLLAVTDQGDFVLDNRFDAVLPWDRVGYRWIARQSPDHILRWHRVATKDDRRPRRDGTVLARRFP